MKTKHFLLLLLLLPTATVFADGGGLLSTSQFSYYDRVNNLFYSTVDGHVRIKDKKGKTIVCTATPNIAIYNIAAKSTTYIFDTTTFKGSVTDLWFEQEYDAARNRIRFNQSNAGDENGGNIENNFNVPKREVSNNMLIKTYSFETGISSFWICDKQGKNLKKVMDLDPWADYHIDAFNQCLRILLRKEHKNEIYEIKY